MATPANKHTHKLIHLSVALCLLACFYCLSKQAYAVIRVYIHICVWVWVCLMVWMQWGHTGCHTILLSFMASSNFSYMHTYEQQTAFNCCNYLIVSVVVVVVITSSYRVSSSQWLCEVAYILQVCIYAVSKCRAKLHTHIYTLICTLKCIHLYVCLPAMATAACASNCFWLSHG